MPSKKVEDRFQRNLRFAGLIKSIDKGLQETLGPSAVDERISAIEIAQRPLQAIGPGLHHEPFVLLMPAHPHRESQFERHVEARRAAAKLYSREIMDGDGAASQQVLNPFEPPLRARDLDHPAGPQPEPAQPGDGRQIEGCVPPIEGDVQKNFGSGGRLAQRACLTRAGRYAAFRATLRRGFAAVPRPLTAATEALYFTRNSSTSREILR